MIDGKDTMTTQRRCLTGTKHLRITNKIMALALVLLISACASPPRQEELITEDSAFPKEQAQATIATAFETITKKFIHPVKVSDLSVTGLKALSRMDKGLLFKEDDKHLTLQFSGAPIWHFVKPDEDEIEEWAETLVDATLLARRVSKEVRSKSQDDLYRAMLESMLQSIDEFSHYADPSKALSHQAKRHGYGGIGIILDKSKAALRIEKVFPESPAFRAGLQVDDQITHVNGDRVLTLSLAEVAKLIRGPVMSKVSLRVDRTKDNLSFEVDVERSRVIRPTVEISGSPAVPILAVSGFNKDTAASLKRAIQKVLGDTKHAEKGFVLDLRGNPGGLLRQSVRVSDLFIAGGKLIGARGRHPQANRSYRADQVDIANGLPLVVVVDGKSASAAEIVATTLQDRGRAVVVGTTSYGKGTVQTITRLPNGGEMTLTWSRLMPPSGYFYHRLGVLPTLCTSGASTPDDEIIGKAMDDNNFIATLARWRTVGFEDHKARKELRKTCEPQRRKGDTELKIAVKLIEDAFLYESFLGLDTQGQALAP